MDSVVAFSFRHRLFRVLIAVGAITACLVSLALSIQETASARRFLSDDLHRNVALASDMAVDAIEHKEWRPLTLLFARARAWSMLCVYDHDNHLVHDWRLAGDRCPVLIREMGSRETFSSAEIAQPVKHAEAYRGVVFVRATLLSPDSIAMQVAAIFLALTLVAFLTCVVAAHYGSRHFNQLMEAIRQQIECLKGDASRCLLPSAMATSETLALFDGIRSLRVHLVNSLVPKEVLEHMRHWHENIFFNLFSLLRHRISEDSVLLPVLSDCELFLRLNSEEHAPEPEVADIAQLVDEGFASARALNPPEDQVHLAVSCKTGSIREWEVQADYVRALVRHLLLIAIGRTRGGLISLRFEIVARPEKTDRALLAWRLEDSGPQLQPGVLHGMLIDTPYKIISVTETSWWLAVHLTKRLQGTIQGESAADGLVLRGEIPLRYSEYGAREAVLADNFPPQHQMHPRLVLMVKSSQGESQALCRLLEANHCRVIWAANAIQALELAPAMPFSAIILQEGMFSRDASALVRQLLALMENKWMPVTPLWVVTASKAVTEHKAWSESGVSHVLPVPASQEKLAALCRQLAPFDTRFWAACDVKLLKDFSRAVKTRLPEMRAELLAQIQHVRHVIAALPRKPVTQSVIHNVHGVKSSALAMGHMRLAALMANLEHWLAGNQTENAANNIAVLADCLEEITLE